MRRQVPDGLEFFLRALARLGLKGYLTVSQDRVKGKAINLTVAIISRKRFNGKQKIRNAQTVARAYFSVN